MKYMGSKNRIAKELLHIILKYRKEGQWYVEPFVGGANMIDKVDGNRIGCDSNEYLIELLKYVQSGGELPDYISEEEYQAVRTNPDMFDKYMVGFIGFCCSFGGKWFGVFARNIKQGSENEHLNKTTHNYCAQSKRNLLKQAPNIKDVIFQCKSYLDINFKQNCIIYCDPPYEGTTKYKDDFNHEIFWNKVREWVKEGHKVFISEYNAPDDFVCVWEKDTLANFSLQNDIGKKRTEKLFIHKSQVNA